MTHHPLPGDVLIRKVTRSEALYDLSVVPEPPQLSCQTLEAAVERGRAFAKRRGVDVWYTDDANVFVLLRRYRPSC